MTARPDAERLSATTDACSSSMIRSTASDNETNVASGRTSGGQSWPPAASQL